MGFVRIAREYPVLESLQLVTEKNEKNTEW